MLPSLSASSKATSGSSIYVEKKTVGAVPPEISDAGEVVPTPASPVAKIALYGALAAAALAFVFLVILPRLRKSP